MNKFFSKLYRRLIKEAIACQKRREGPKKMVYGCAADLIGDDGSVLTTTQKSTRRDCIIIFEAAYVRNAKLILTDDHKFLDCIANQDIKEIFWEVSRRFFKIDLHMDICSAASKIDGL